MELSKKTQKAIAIVCVIVLLAIGASLVIRQFSNNSSNTTPTNTTSSKSSEKQSSATDKKTATPSASETSKNYQYTAAAGDSYTGFARDAVNKYASSQNLTLNSDQILNAEVKLANNAGLPLLEIGQAVTIKSSDISAVLDTKPTDTTQPKTVAKESKPSSDKNEAKSLSTDSYSYTAVASDSYTLLARDAIGKYIANSQTNLTKAQRIAAETYLADAANFPEINIGQAISFSKKDDIKVVVDKASSLSASEQASWQPYVALTNL